MAMVYRTTSSEALCILTEMTHINIKLEKFVKRYINKQTESHTFGLDSAVEFKHWLHLEDAVTIKMWQETRKHRYKYTSKKASMGKESGQAQLSS
jgi:hypothetical protein